MKEQADVLPVEGSCSASQTTPCCFIFTWPMGKTLSSISPVRAPVHGGWALKAPLPDTTTFLDSDTQIGKGTNIQTIKNQ